MMRHLLAQRFPTEYGLNPNTITLPLEVKKGSFILSDSKACTACKASRTNRGACDEENLNIRSSVDVAVLEFESYIQQFKKTSLSIKGVCDYLLFDESNNHRKIAFCDLTCSDEKWVNPNTGRYPEGKRAKVKSQMLDSLEYLLTEDLLKVAILTFADKVCLFGWRDFDNPAVNTVVPVHNNVRKNMQVFGRTPSSMAKQLTFEKTILGHGFSFVQVKYPSVYDF